jgi:hypothetical protein
LTMGALLVRFCYPISRQGDREFASSEGDWTGAERLQVEEPDPSS